MWTNVWIFQIFYFDVGIINKDVNPSHGDRKIYFLAYLASDEWQDDYELGYAIGTISYLKNF